MALSESRDSGKLPNYTTELPPDERKFCASQRRRAATQVEMVFARLDTISFQGKGFGVYIGWVRKWEFAIGQRTTISAGCDPLFTLSYPYPPPSPLSLLSLLSLLSPHAPLGPLTPSLPDPYRTASVSQKGRW